ncbi:hypothetical protein FBU30_008156 [Linnemannia zychae]|nr:hypothetical protein FBU30_008156 [Linnemannia zychae]
MVSRLHRLLSKLQPKQLKELKEGVQAVRIGPLSANKIYYITTHPDSSSSDRNVILWNDILVVFPNAAFIQHDVRVLPFLKGKDLKDLEPRRITAIPDAILEVVLQDTVVTVATIGTRAIQPNLKTELDTTVDMSTPTNWTLHPTMQPSKTEIEEIDDHAHPKLMPNSNNNSGINDTNGITQAHPTVSSNLLSTPKLLNGKNNSDIRTTSQPSLLVSGRHSVKNEGINLVHNQHEDHQAPMDQSLTKTINGNLNTQMKIAQQNGAGQGAPHGFPKALQGYLKAAEQGNPDAQCYIGYMYERGQEVPKDDVSAMNWYLKSANQGNAPAQINIGFMFERGQGIKQDYLKAFEWYLKAAHQGLPQAQANIGFMYEYGQGTQKDYVKATEWYKRAADQGSTAAQMGLKRLTKNNLALSSGEMHEEYKEQNRFL